MNHNGPTLFYLPRFDDADLAYTIRRIFDVYVHAPRLCGGLADALVTEQTRRLRSHAAEPAETELLILPFHHWSTNELKLALSLVTVLSYTEQNYMFGQLIDSLVRNLVAATCARMMRLEETCQR
jgi:hypothetical protein